MGRLLAALCLALTLSGQALADDFAGNAGTIHIDAPKGYCFLPKTDPDYDGFRRIFEASGGGVLSVQAVFLDCSYTHNRTATPARGGFIGVLTGGGARLVVPDLGRSAWLAGVAKAVRQDPRAVAKVDANGLGNGVLYLRKVAVLYSAGASSAEISLDGLTVVRDTAVVISQRRVLPTTDTAGLVGVLDDLREVQKASLAGFARANGFTINDAPSTEQAGSSLILGLFTAASVFGAVLIFAIVVKPWWLQAILAALTAIAGALVYQAAPGAVVFTRIEAIDILLFVALALALLAAGAGALRLLAGVRIGTSDVAAIARHTLDADLWAGGKVEPLPLKDVARRWFVTISAATGSVVAALLTEKHFVDLLAHAFSPARIIFTVLITIVSVTLIGPVEEYIFGLRFAAPVGVGAETAPPARSRFEHMAQLLSPRAFGRFVLVLFFLLQLTVLHGALEERVRERDGSASLTILLASLGPGVVTYYWCAALQRAAASVARRAGAAATLAGALLAGLPLFLGLLVFSLGLLQASRAGATAVVLAMLVLLVPGAVAFGFIVMGAFGYAGGLVIDYARARDLSPTASVGLVGVALCLATGAMLLPFWAVITGIYRAKLTAEDNWSFVLPLIGPVGWALGLLVSGFPDVLRAGRAAIAPPAMAA